MDAAWQRLDAALRQGMPVAISVLMTLLSAMVWPLPYLGSVMPPLAFMALYYWACHRPDLFTSAAAFLLGLLNDLLHGLPPGVSALLFTLAHQVIYRLRRLFAGHAFRYLWAGFAVAAGLLMIGEWVLVSLVNWRLVPLFPVLVQTVLGILVFPLPCWILIRLQRAVLTSG